MNCVMRDHWLEEKLGEFFNDEKEKGRQKAPTQKKTLEWGITFLACDTGSEAGEGNIKKSMSHGVWKSNYLL